MKRVFTRPYVYWTAAIFIFYLLLAILLSGFYTTFQLILRYTSTVNWWKLSMSILLSLLIGMLVAINSVYLSILYRERQQCKSATALTSIGTVGGLVTGICPLCITGIIPLIFAFFGVSFSLGALPLQGIEIQLLTVSILFLSLYTLRRKSYGKKN